MVRCLFFSVNDVLELDVDEVDEELDAEEELFAVVVGDTVTPLVTVVGVLGEA